MVLLNDASIHGQFQAFETFQLSLKRIFGIRKKLRQLGQSLRVTRNLRNLFVTSGKTVDEFLGSLPRDMRVELLLWIGKQGPFWETPQTHSPGDYFECGPHLVTDTALGEAAHFEFVGERCAVISVAPSDFTSDPLEIKLKSDSESFSVEIRNGWTEAMAQKIAEELEQIPKTWEELIYWTRVACPRLILSPDLNEQLGILFYPNVAKRSQALLKVLNEVVDSLVIQDQPKFGELRRQFMEGDKAWFSNSSQSECHEFRNEMTFRHPTSGEDIFCPWHGKIKTPQFRIHFQWPLPPEKQLFIGYLGPKITKR